MQMEVTLDSNIAATSMWVMVRLMTQFSWEAPMTHLLWHFTSSMNSCYWHSNVCTRWHQKFIAPIISSQQERISCSICLPDQEAVPQTDESAINWSLIHGILSYSRRICTRCKFSQFRQISWLLDNSSQTISLIYRLHWRWAWFMPQRKVVDYPAWVTSKCPLAHQQKKPWALEQDCMGNKINSSGHYYQWSTNC